MLLRHRLLGTATSLGLALFIFFGPFFLSLDSTILFPRRGGFDEHCVYHSSINCI